MEPAAVVSTLTDAEQKELTRCEETIRRGWQSFVEVGEALNRIHDQRLYRDRYERFEEYYRAEWQYQKSQVYRLMGAAKVVRVLSPIGEKADENLLLPVSEAQVRPLLGLEEKQIKRLWHQTVEQAAGKPITARLVQKQVSLAFPPSQRSATPAGTHRSSPEPNHLAEIEQVLEELVGLAAKNTRQRKRAGQLKEQILRLVQAHRLR